MSQLDNLVTDVAAKVDDPTVSFVAGKLQINRHDQRRKIIFTRTNGSLRFSTGPARAPFGIPVGSQGTMERRVFTRFETVAVTMRAEDEDALDGLFDAVVNAIFAVGGPNVFENDNPYDWAGKDSQAAGQNLARHPELTFYFKMQLASHPKPQPYAVIENAQATLTELGHSVAIAVPGP